MNRDVEVFADAVALPAAERGAFLDRACAGDAALRAHVEVLLQAHNEATGFLEKPLATRAPAATEEQPGDRETFDPASPLMSTLASTEFVRRILLGAAVIIAAGHSVPAQIPTITSHPVTQALAPGRSVTLSVAATGSGPLTYQWSRNGVALPGATNATYAITNARLADAGRYSVAVTAAAGTTTSAPAQVNLSGLLWAVGDNRNGQLGDGTTILRELPLRLTDGVSAVASGESHSLFLKADGTLWAMGSNGSGKLGDGTTDSRSMPVQVASGVTAVAAGSLHSLYLKTDGTLWAMGYNTFGQLGDGTMTSRRTPVQVASGVSAVAAGPEYSLYLKTDGTLWATGYNGSGQLGDGTTTFRHTPVQVASGVTAVAAGSSHSMYLKTDGTLWAMGYNGSGQLGDGTTTQRNTPVQVAGGVSAVAAGLFHSLYVKTDGALWAMGNNYYGQLGDGTTTSRSTPLQVAENVLSAAAGNASSFFIQADGVGVAPTITTQPAGGTFFPQPAVTLTVAATGSGPLDYRWRKDGVELPRERSATLYIPFVQTASAGSYTVEVSNSAGAVTSAPALVALYVLPTITAQPVTQAITPGGALTLSVTATGSGPLTYQWSRNGVALPGATTATYTIANAHLADAGRYSVTVTDSVGPIASAPAQVSLSGMLWGVGSNTNGQLGVDPAPAIQTTSPVQVASGVSAMTAGGDHCFYVGTDGSLWAMGNNYAGQLGDGSTASSTTVLQVSEDVRVAAAGDAHSLYLKTDGTLWATGSNNAGQLGDGTTTSRSTPIQVASGVTAVAAGGGHSLYVKTDGTLWAMGNNYYGQLGDGTTTWRSTPVQVASGVTAVAAGWSHSLYLKTDGTLWAMGANSDGQLGDGTTTSRRTPVQVASGVSVVAAGSGHSLYLKTDGTLWALGNNDYSQLGDGTTTSRRTPVQVAGGVSAVAAGSGHSMYLKTDGTLWAIGSNGWGQLGDGTTTSRRTPVQVASGVTAVAASWHSLYLKTDGTLWAMGSSTYRRNMRPPQFTPVWVASGVSSVVGSYAHYAHSLYLKTDGTLWAMGYNYYGQLGDGTTTSRSTPVQLASGVTAVAAGGIHSLYLKTDGTLWAMGSNYYGQLGDGTTTDRSTPVQVAGGVSAVGAGGSHSLYLKTDGTLWAMGNNWAGQLGDGTTTSRSTPVQVASGVSAVAAGAYHNLYVKTDGTLWAMGRNSSGQLGDGTTTDRSTPVQVASGVTMIAAGGNQSMYLSADGSLWEMGANYIGEDDDNGGAIASAQITPLRVAGNVLGMGLGSWSRFFIQAAASGTVPTIVTSPAGGTYAAWSPVTLTVGATGSGPFDYRWRKDGVEIPNVRSATLELASLQPSDAGDYTVVVTNSAGSVTSNPATLVIAPRAMAGAYFGTLGGNVGTFALFVRPDGRAVFLGQAHAANAAFVCLDVVVDANRHFQIPADALASAGATALNAHAIEGTISAYGTISGQISGLNLALYAPAVQTSGRSAAVAGFYQAGAPGNSAASYTIVGAGGDAYVVTVDGTTADAGRGTVDATGRLAVTTAGGATIAGTLDMRAGTIRLDVTPPSGVATAFLGANRETPARLVNLSIRSQIGSAANPLIAGFVVTGDQPKPVLLRVVGPTLANFGVSGALSAARLEVLRGATSLAVGNDWGTGANATAIATAAARVGAFPLPAGSRDAALLLTLDPGAYSAVAGGQEGAAGVGLLEVHDATPGTIPPGQRIINLSTRATVGTGEGAFLAGFVISGTLPQRVLIRAAGPSLARFGVAGALTLPQLTVSSGNTILAHNLVWSTSPDLWAIAASAAQVGAFSFLNGSMDAALIINLAPGAYTAQVSGVGGTTGVALVEVYELQ